MTSTREHSPPQATPFDWPKPVFYRTTSRTITRTGSTPLEVAQCDSQELDLAALFELTTIGFPLNGRTLFESVRRLLPGEKLESAGFHTELAPNHFPGAFPDDIVQTLGHFLCSASSDNALELSAGLDSRLLLALSTIIGQPPNFCFTIGPEHSHDVVVAKALADLCKIRHFHLPVTIAETIVEDTEQMIRGSGYNANAASYGWLPGTLSPLDNHRRAQISGVGGEIVGSFYYTPFDWAFARADCIKQWIDWRLNRPWLGAHRLWNKDRRRFLRNALYCDVKSALGDARPWRDAVDRFYWTQRMGQWAIPVLQASQQYYEVVAPYLSLEYAHWAFSLPEHLRFGRRAQRDLLQQIAPPLATFSGENQSRPPNLSTRIRKAFRRLTRSQRPAPVGTVETAKALAQSRRMRDQVLNLIETTRFGFNRDFVQEIIKRPEDAPELFGILVTFAIAFRDLCTRTRTNAHCCLQQRSQQ